jgi:hypothetical protein
MLVDFKNQPQIYLLPAIQFLPKTLLFGKFFDLNELGEVFSVNLSLAVLVRFCLTASGCFWILSQQ